MWMTVSTQMEERSHTGTAKQRNEIALNLYYDNIKNLPPQSVLCGCQGVAMWFLRFSKCI